MNEAEYLMKRDTNMVAGNQWKHREFTLALSKYFFSLLNFKTFA